MDRSLDKRQGKVGKSLTSSKIHHKDTGEHLWLEVYFLIYQTGFVLILQMFLLILPTKYTMGINSRTTNNGGKNVLFKIHVLNYTYQKTIPHE